MPAALRIILLSAICCVLSFCVFAPRFYLWRVPGNPYFPENNRANLELFQLRNPYAQIPSQGDRHLEWRILFPVVAHALHLNPLGFFVLPFLFCFLMVLYGAGKVYQETKDVWAAIAAGLLVATSGAFFVSTGFLGYFDSALMFFLLVASLEKKNLWVWAAIALAPWIDDRAIFALPIVAWCQWARGERFGKLPILLLGLLPYLAARIFAVVCNTDATQSLLGQIFHSWHEPERLFWGWWDALRWGWAFVVLALAWSSPLKRFTGMLLLPVAMTMLLLSAGDYSRSMTVAMPLMLLGLMALHRHWPAKIRFQPWPVILAFAALNLFTPASHSFRAFQIRLYPIDTQIKIGQFLKKHPECMAP